MNTPNPKLRALLSSPMVGFAPWILMAVVEGPGRVVLAACLAGALAVALTAGGAAAGLRPKLLDITGIGYFAALAVAAAESAVAWSGYQAVNLIARTTRATGMTQDIQTLSGWCSGPSPM